MFAKNIAVDARVNYPLYLYCWVKKDAVVNEAEVSSYTHADSLRNLNLSNLRGCVVGPPKLYNHR